ncbi:uncharacterized protein LOC131082093 isoform X43 [Melospiza georgiana]|uniref:uncharacterized protein LOC131082093 isoform X43 n=1 Tax=Melospiza georgiana TaxID=44398 RepID=UPI0025AD4559|nr:uncharacterized protein LOC131082093 isoform X43 [Melospiza georgiana]
MGYTKGCYGAQDRVFVMGHRTGCYGAQSRVFVMGHRTGCLLWGTEQGVCYGAQDRVLWGTGQGVMGHRTGCLLWGTEQGVCYGAQDRVLWGTDGEGVMGHRTGCYGAQSRVFVMGHRAGCLLWGTEQGVMGHRAGCYGAQKGCLLWGTGQGVCYGAQSRVFVMGHRAGCYGAQKGCLLWGTGQAGCYGAQMEREGRSRGQWWRAPGRAVLDGRGEDPWAVQGCARPAGKGSGWPSTAMCGWDMAAELCPAPVSLWVSPFHTCALLPRPPSPVLSAGAPRGAGTRPAAKSSLPTTVLESPSLGDSKPTWPRP